MDTKTPPIPLKHHLERSNKFKTQNSGRQVQVSLPPLTPPPNRRQRSKTPGSPWARSGYSAPGIYPGNVKSNKSYQEERPYRVLHIGATPLMHACQQADRSRVLRLLKEQRETIGYRDRTLRSALHYCMDAGTGGAVVTAAPELVNAPDAEGHTPLHLAVIAGDSQLVAVLLANGADVNAKDLEGHSVLHWATVCGEVECVRLVLAAGGRPSTPDMRGGSPLHYAAQCCGAAAPTELAVPKKVGLKVLQSLIDYGANCNAKDEDGRQPILWAASAGSVEAVLALARAGGSAAAGASDKDGLTALHCAASRGHAGCVEALVNLCGSQPDHVDDNGCSALHYAATLGHADATALLLRLGADPNRQDRKGRTPALCAAAKGQLETLKLLAQHGGSLYARTVRGSGVAHESAASGRIELIKWLAKKRPGILDTATHDGRTPLHVAALHGHVDACKVLLDNGARVNAILRTAKGSQMTPLDAALYRGHRDCAKLIQMHGGTNAQHIKSRKGLSHKEFAAKLRLKRRESSSESDVEAPIRRRLRRRGSRSGPDHQYYEERWEERRSTRRRRSDRGGSRSYSDQDELVSDVRNPNRKKTTSKSRSRQRRARSESARYEEDRESTEEIKKRHKKRPKRNSKGRKHEYNESSTDLESFLEGENLSDEEETVSELGPSASDDSLEVVIVKKSVEKTSERVEVSGRKQTPRGDERSVENTKRSKSRRGKRETVRKKSPCGSKKSKSPNTDHEEPQQSREEEVKDRKMRYHIETADSTSQEAVERVTVTVMVHKDNNSDTSKTMSTESSKNDEEKVKDVHKDEEVEEEEPKKKTRPRSARPGSRGSRASSARTRMDHILEKADEMQSALVQKAADLKKGIEEMREHISSGQSEEHKDESGGEGKQTEEKGTKEAEDDLVNAKKELKNDVEANKRIDESIVESKSDHGDSEKGNPDEVKAEERVEDASKTEESSSEPVEVGSPSVSSAERLGNDEVAGSDPEGNVQVGRSSSRKSASSSSKSRPSTAGRKSGGSHMEKKSSTQTSEGRASKRGSGKSVDDDDGVREIEEGQADESVKTSIRGKLADARSDSGGSGDDVKAASLSNPSEKKVSVVNSESSLEEANLPELPEEEEDEENKAERSSEAVDDQPITSSRRSKSRTGSQKSADRSSSQSQSRPSTAKQRTRPSSSSSASKSRMKKRNSSEESSSPNRATAIVAVIESPEWPEDEEDEEINNEIRDAIGDYPEPDTDPDDNSVGVMRVLPNTSDDETPRTVGFSRTSGIDSLPQVASRPRPRLPGVLQSPVKEDSSRLTERHRRDSGGRDSGIEPSPRISKIPRRSNGRRYPNTDKQQSLNMETVTRDVQISLRRYHLERKIFFQLMELKRLQIRHGRANEQVLVKRQVEAFHRAGTTGPTLGVAKYDQPLTFRHFESFLYEQLRRLQRRPATPEWCTGAKQCTQKTHRCHHATSAYTSLPVYTYLGVTGDRAGNLLPNIEGRGKGQMTVEVTHGEDKQVIALPAEKLDRSKRYFVTFTVRGESQRIRDRKHENEKTATSKHSASSGDQRNAKSV